MEEKSGVPQEIKDAVREAGEEVLCSFVEIFSYENEVLMLDGADELDEGERLDVERILEAVDGVKRVEWFMEDEGGR